MTLLSDLVAMIELHKPHKGSKNNGWFTLILCYTACNIDVGSCSSKNPNHARHGKINIKSGRLNHARKERAIVSRSISSIKVILNDPEYNKSRARAATEGIFDGKGERRSMFRRDITENQRPA